jgi:hypothetical protein
VTDVRNASTYWISLCSKPGISKSVVCVCVCVYYVGRTWQRVSAVRIHTGICPRFYLHFSCEGLEPFAVHKGRQICTLFSPCHVKVLLKLWCMNSIILNQRK